MKASIRLPFLVMFLKGRTDSLTAGWTDGQPENIMPLLASRRWHKKWENGLTSLRLCKISKIEELLKIFQRV